MTACEGVLTGFVAAAFRPAAFQSRSKPFWVSALGPHPIFT